MHSYTTASRVAQERKLACMFCVRLPKQIFTSSMGSESNTQQESRGTSSHTTQCHDKHRYKNWTLFFSSPVRRTEIVDNDLSIFTRCSAYICNNMETHTSSYIVEVGLGGGYHSRADIDCHRAPHLDYKGSAGVRGGGGSTQKTKEYIYIHTYILLCYAMLCYTILYHTILYYITLYDIPLYYVPFC